MTNVNSTDAHGTGATDTLVMSKQVPSGVITVGLINTVVTVNLDHICHNMSYGNV